MDRQEALTVLAYMINKLGGGYHPDSPICEYVRMFDGVPTFSRIEAEQLQSRHDEMVAVLGNEVYEAALTMLGAL